MAEGGEPIAIMQPKSYDQAVELLADLRDLAAPKDGSASAARSRRCAWRTPASGR